MSSRIEHALMEETYHQSLAQVLLCASENGIELCDACRTRHNNLRALLDLDVEETLGLKLPMDKSLVLFGALAEFDKDTTLKTAELLKFCRAVKNTLYGPFGQVAARIMTPEFHIDV